MPLCYSVCLFDETILTYLVNKGAVSDVKDSYVKLAM